MPRYFIDTFDNIVALDDEGVELPDLAALRRVVHRTLSEMMRDEPDGRSGIQCRADVRDEHGGRVLTATLLIVITERHEGTDPASQMNRAVTDGVEHELAQSPRQ